MKYLVVLATFFLSTTLLYTDEIPKNINDRLFERKNSDVSAG